MTKMPKARALKAKAAVITVGEARGFVIEHGHDRLVVTAAHCLPRNDEGQLLSLPLSAAYRTRKNGPMQSCLHGSVANLPFGRNACLPIRSPILPY